MSPSPREEGDDGVILSAIEHAERAARADDARFMRELLTRLNDERERNTGRLRTVRAPSAATGPKSFHIYEDPRYLRNARELARRFMARTRVIGGRTMRPGDFPDCVAVGSDDQWGCTGTLITPRAVLTAGHCAEFATRVYFGSDVSEPGTIVRVRRRVRHARYHRVRDTTI